MPQPKISREPIRTEVRRILLERLLSGELEPGARINESTLAAQLGVSRTPLREALLKLEFESFLRSAPGKGFSVAPLSSEGARNLYSLVGLLEPLAVETAGELDEATLEQLEEIEEGRLKANQNHDLEQAVGLANRWHDVLVGTCPNKELLDILSVLKRRLYRYEYLLAEEVSQSGGQSHDHHSQIVTALRTGNLALAVRELKDHWKFGAETRSKLLSERERPGETPKPKDKWTSLM